MTAPSSALFDWLRCCQSVDQDALMKIVGLDGYVFLRFITICFRYAILCCFWGLVVLVMNHHHFSYSNQCKKRIRIRCLHTHSMRQSLMIGIDMYYPALKPMSFGLLCFSPTFFRLAFVGLYTQRYVKQLDQTLNPLISIIIAPKHMQ